MRLWRVLAGMLAAGFVAAGVTPAWACACGGYLPDAQSQARAYGEHALVRHDAGTEQITLSMAINGSSKKAAWIMPVPAAAKVELGDPDLFYRLNRMTRPKVVERKTYWPFRNLGIMAGGDTAGAAAPGSGVDVREQMVLGPFQVVRLGGSTGSAVTDWLRTTGYVVPAGLAANLTPYLSEGWEIVAVKLAPKTGGERISGETPPLRLTFASDRIVYPMRLSKGASTAQTVTVYVASAHRVDATKLPDADVRPELLYAGRVQDDAMEAPADFLTAYAVTYRDPSKITSDFTFDRAATDDEFQRIEYVTRNDGLLSTIGVLLGGVLLIGAAAAVIARVLVRRSSTDRPGRPTDIV
ncbi:DUF2330 domain-containing protein [Kribbella capetownensis]|uniref:DUF2330 domain-containing protein n=1 Tax=Kribbella capetownensis TaxID=1572659 RepID=A0A4R0JN37_9ACTN|nr:DUF2330 domain-containing protein [Kribbella capetownensis]TCC48623.1 DUF2330 domain-containing protein [Kribbella capetownensis]